MENKKQKIVATIEARLNSTRLPGKILLEIKGKPVLQIFIERAQKSKLIDDIVVATTTNPKDIAIINLCKEIGVKYYMGSEDDVLDRVLKAAKSLNADIIVELISDNPLIDPEVIDNAIQYFLDNDYDYISNFHPITFPSGIGIQVFPSKILEEVSKLTNDPFDRENVTWYIYHHKEKYNCGNYPAPKELKDPKLRLDLDYQEDYELIKKIYNNFSTFHFSLKDVLTLLKQKPELRKINANRYIGDEKYV